MPHGRPRIEKYPPNEVEELIMPSRIKMLSPYRQPILRSVILGTREIPRKIYRGVKFQFHNGINSGMNGPSRRLVFGGASRFLSHGVLVCVICWQGSGTWLGISYKKTNRFLTPLQSPSLPPPFHLRLESSVNPEVPDRDVAVSSDTTSQTMGTAMEVFYVVRYIR